MLIYWSGLFWGQFLPYRSASLQQIYVSFQQLLSSLNSVSLPWSKEGPAGGGREFHKALKSIKLAKFNPSTWLNIILEMLWWHPQKIQLYFQMTAFSDLLTVNNISFVKMFFIKVLNSSTGKHIDRKESIFREQAWHMGNIYRSV